MFTILTSRRLDHIQAQFECLLKLLRRSQSIGEIQDQPGISWLGRQRGPARCDPP